MKRLLLRIKIFFMLLNFEKRYLFYIGKQIGIDEINAGKKLDYDDLSRCNKYLSNGIKYGYESVINQRRKKSERS